MFKQLDQYDLAMIEQPLMHDDLIDHAALQAQIRHADLPGREHYVAGQGPQSHSDSSLPLDQHQAWPGGGITNAVAIHDLCREAGVPCWIGGMLESAVGAHAAWPGHAAQYSLSVRHLSHRIVSTARTWGTGHAALGSRPVLPSMKPGVGAEPNLDALQRMTLEQAVFKA